MSEGGKSFKIILLAISVGWLPVFVSAVIQGYEENNKGIGLQYNTVFINILGVFCIIAGAAVAYFAKTYQKSAVINTNRNEVKERLILKGLMAMALIGGIFSYYRWKSIGIDPLSFDSDMYYQMNLVYADEGHVITGIWGRLNSMATLGAMFVMYLYYENKIDLKRLLIYCAIFIVILISPRRAAMFTTMLSMLFLFLMRSRVFSIRNVIFAVIFLYAFIMIFGYTQYSLGKMMDFSIWDSVDMAMKYVESSVFVMDKIINTDHFDKTWIMLSVPARIIGELFGIDPGVDLSIPFVYVPEPSNTVPAFYYFFKSGSYFGVIIYSLAVGYFALVFVRQYLIRKTFHSAVIGSLFLTGILLSVRDCIFITYDFIFWIVTSYLISVVLHKKILWERKF
jgi:oligosaccharide repeat unit polymerase